MFGITGINKFNALGNHASMNDHIKLLLTGFFIIIDLYIRLIFKFIPASLVSFCQKILNGIFDKWDSDSKRRKISEAKTFTELALLHDYEVEEHYVTTADGFIITIFRVKGRISTEKASSNGSEGGYISPVSDEDSSSQPLGGIATGRSTVLILPGLMMSSDVFIVHRNPVKCLPFYLFDLGYDVWIGNFRGNKYAHKHQSLKPSDKEFWNFSLDELAYHDVPAMSEYVLKTSNEKKLNLIAFSQGFAVTMAALSMNSRMANRINCLVALAPVIVPSFKNAYIGSLTKVSSRAMFLFLGHGPFLHMAQFWRKLLPKALYNVALNVAMNILFGWNCRSIRSKDKMAMYQHLYSFTSTKLLLHWCQIAESGKFQWFNDDFSISPSSDEVYMPTYQISKITIPTVLLGGESDTLCHRGDLDLMIKNCVHSKCIPNYEHLDLIWANDVDKTVFIEIQSMLETLGYTSPSPPSSSKKQQATGSSASLVVPLTKSINNSPFKSSS